MSSTFDDAVLDFDLNFFSQSSKTIVNTNIPNKAEKQRKSIILAKKKTIATDSLVRRYYEKKESLDQTERELFASKDECRQVCVDYKNLMEKYGNLEQHKQQLDTANHELHSQYISVQNQYVALQSHVNQLQVLVKEYEKQIDTMKEEHKAELHLLEKGNKFSAQKNIHEMLKRHINFFIQVAVGKKKLNDIPKNILMKYEDAINKNLADIKLESKLNETTLDNDSESPQEELLIEKETALGIMDYKTGNGKSVKRPDSEHDLDEVVSSGRGSSLAFSDSEKCFQSPEYYMHDSPVPHRIPVKQMNVATSPIPILETVNRAVSPIIFENYVSLPLLCSQDVITTSEIKSSPSVDKGVQVNFESPIRVPETSEKIAESPVIIIDCNSPVISQNVCSAFSPENSEPLPSPVNFDNGNDDEEFMDMSEESNSASDPCINSESNITITHEIKCLEQNNSKTISAENDVDYEVERILNMMRWKQFKMVTPIPNTPVKNNNTNIAQQTDTTIIESDHMQNSCKETEKMQEDHKLLHAGLAQLAKEIMNIKSILKKKLPDDPVFAKSDFVESCQNIIDTNKQMQTQETIPKSPIRHGHLPIEVIGIPEDKIASSLFDKPIEIPTHKTLIIEEESQDIVMPEEENTPTIQNRLQFEDGLSIEDCHDLRDDDAESLDYSGPDLIICNYDESTKTNTVDSEKCKKPKEKVKKLTKLEKIRRRLIPKRKIVGYAPISRKKKNKVNLKNKLISNINKPKKVITESDNSATLNDKKVYEKALKVMADLKSVQKKQFKSKKKTVLNKVVNTTVSNIIGKSTNKETVTNVENNIKNLLETIIPNSPIKRSRRISAISKDIEESDKTRDSSPENEDRTPRKLRRRGLKRSAEMNCPQQQSRRVLRSSVRRQASIDSIEHPNESITTPSPEKIRKVSVDVANSEISNKEIEPTPSPKKIRNDSVDVANSEISNKEIEPTPSPKKIRNDSVDVANSEISNKEIEPTPSPKKIRKDSVDVDDSKISNKEIGPTRHIKAKNEENQVQFVETVKNKSKNNENIPNETTVRSMKCTELPEATLTNTEMQKNNSETHQTSRCIHPKDSILCKMIEQHANYTGKRSRKTADALSTLICEKITESVAHIMALPLDESKPAMDKLVIELQNWKVNNFLSGLMNYLKCAERKVELFNKVKMPPAPDMSKSEQIMLYVIVQLNNSKIWKCNVLNSVLDNIEFTLFQLNNTPHFDVIESMSHFYAVLCRYLKNKSRLRLFMMDAMYCLQFKSIPLIKQCIEVWMHAIPMSSMNIAKSPLVMVLVYLLHFYKCEDRFNRVSEIRNLLHKKYLYNLTEWNDYKIIEMLRKSIKELRDIPIERKMMKLALIIISKRLGFRWCHENMIKKILLPLIEKEVVCDKSREFCVSMLGPLLRPFPAVMKVQGEITVNQMLDMLEQNPSPTMEEAIFTSLIYINRHNPNQILKVLTTWSPQKVSPECENLLKDFIQSRPVKAWKAILSKLPID